MAGLGVAIEAPKPARIPPGTTESVGPPNPGIVVVAGIPIPPVKGSLGKLLVSPGIGGLYLGLVNAPRMASMKLGP